MTRGSIDNAVDIAQAIHSEPGCSMESKRFALARACGYLDARFIVNLYETYGFPLEEAGFQGGTDGLKIDKEGLRHELLMIGMNQRTCELMIERALSANLDGYRRNGAINA